MDKNIIHLLQRLVQFKKLGYDMLKERNFALKKAEFKKNKDILEIGTGRGFMALTLAKKGFKVTTIDSDSRIQRIARSILRYYHLEKFVRFKTMDAERILFDDDSFDYVLAVNFMHHAKKPFICLKEMVRVAKEKILIVDVNKRGAKILEEIHTQEGHHHERSRIGFLEVKDFFRKNKMAVETFQSKCQTIIVAKKGC
ncbi:MAG: class I SAM-dependent methyltransferase [Candidatus Omnitrophica bacterium]|nr:class I SAM-dependent methyltransferase [Candidatus Omnitrophota bacterium]HOX55030.1 class I SAM-dependent methyltransferase [Candidatus Omnitrophota bacterium]